MVPQSSFELHNHKIIFLDNEVSDNLEIGTLYIKLDARLLTITNLFNLFLLKKTIQFFAYPQRLAHLN